MLLPSGIEELKISTPMIPVAAAKSLLKRHICDSIQADLDSHQGSKPLPAETHGFQDGEQHKQKSYEAICKLPCALTPEHVEKINACENLLLGQNTPARVAHRRALLLRERMVYTMQCTPLPDDPTTLKLNLRTQVRQFSIQGGVLQARSNHDYTLTQKGCNITGGFLQLYSNQTGQSRVGNPLLIPLLVCQKLSKDRSCQAWGLAGGHLHQGVCAWR